MQRKHRILIALGAVALTGSLLVQTLWIYSGYKQSERNLQEELRAALQETVDELNTWQELSIIADYDAENSADEDAVKHEVHFIQSSEMVIDIDDEDRGSQVRRVIIKDNDTQSIEDRGTAVIRMEYKNDSAKLGETKIEWFSDSVVDQVLAIREDGRLGDIVQKIELEHISSFKDWKQKIDFSAIAQKLNENLNLESEGMSVEMAIVDSLGSPIDSFKTQGFEALGQEFVKTEMFPSDLKSKDVYFKAYYHDLSIAALRNMWLLIFGSITFSILMIGVFVVVIRRMISNSRLSQLKSDFINNMSHELKTPLATIALATDALQHPEVSGNVEQSKDLLSKIQQEHDRILTHVERVLQMAQAEEGNMKLELESQSIKSLIEQSASGFEMHATAKGGSISVEAKDDIELMIDSTQFRSAIDNLIDNALKYGGDKPQVKVSMRSVPRKVLIEVEDNGNGLSEAEAKMAFERFHRGDSGNIHAVKGFGLGLNYVRTIVEAHGGKVYLQSTEGEGTTATIELQTNG